MPSIPSDALTVLHNPEKKRFEIQIGEKIAVLEYIPTNNFLVFSHTEVPPSLEGQGLGSKLAHTGLDYAQEHNLKIMPLCPYVAMYIRRHPEYRPLILPGFHV